MRGVKLFHRVILDENMAGYISDRGGDPRKVREYLGLNQDNTGGKFIYVPWTDFCRAHEHAAQILDDPYFGLRFGLLERKDFYNTGPMVYLMSAATNMRQFINMGIQYQSLHTNGIRYEYEENEANQEVTGVLTFHPMSGPHRQILEHAAILICQMGRNYIPDFEIKRVSFQHRAPENLEWYEKAFGSPVTFNAERNTIVADLKYMEMNRGTVLNGAIEKSLKFYLNRKLKSAPPMNDTIKGSVMEVIPTLIEVNQSDMASVANVLGLHPKKLHRLLSEEGTTYKEIRDNVRHFQAVRLLEDTDMPITRIAQVLDYSSDGPFNVACKRWFGMSPMNYRRSLNHKEMVESHGYLA